MSLLWHTQALGCVLAAGLWQWDSAVQVSLFLQLLKELKIHFDIVLKFIYNTGLWLIIDKEDAMTEILWDKENPGTEIYCK